MNNYKKILFLASLLGALAVVLGAFGAHFLKENIAPNLLETYKTGVQYHFYHVLALLGLGIWSSQTENYFWIDMAAFVMLIGIFLFSGSLYLIATNELLNIQSLKSTLGPMTPIGGVFFIVGWVLVGIAALKQK